MDQNSAAFPRYFVKRSGRIMGPFSLLKLKAMFHSGSLGGYDMFSVDKVNWQYIYILFPDLIPGKVEKREDMQKMELSPAAGEKDDPANGEELAKENRHVLTFFLDMGMTISLIWKYPSYLEEMSKKYGKILGMAGGMNLFFCLLMVLLFGKYGSRNFHYCFSLLAATVILLLLFLLSLLTGWLIGRVGKKVDEIKKGEWQILSAALFMVHGLIAGTLFALQHTLKGEYCAVGALILIAVNSAALCGTAFLLVHAFASFRNMNGEWIRFLAVPFNGLFVAIVWFFMRFI